LIGGTEETAGSAAWQLISSKKPPAAVGRVLRPRKGGQTNCRHRAPARAEGAIRTNRHASGGTRMDHRKSKKAGVGFHRPQAGTGKGGRRYSIGYFARKPISDAPPERGIRSWSWRRPASGLVLRKRCDRFFVGHRAHLIQQFNSKELGRTQEIIVWAVTAGGLAPKLRLCFTAQAALVRKFSAVALCRAAFFDVHTGASGATKGGGGIHPINCETFSAVGVTR